MNPQGAKRERESSFPPALVEADGTADSRKRVALTPPPLPESIQSIAPTAIAVSQLLNSSSSEATQEPLELTGQETRIHRLQPDVHVQFDARDRPRIGGWYVGQPRESARVPDLVVPLGIDGDDDDDDDDDRPLLDEHGGRQDAGQGATGPFWDRPWIEAKRLAKEKQKQDEARRLILLEQEKTRAQEEALRAQQQARQIKAEAQHQHSSPSLSYDEIRDLVQSSKSVPLFLKSDLLEYAQVAMDPSTPHAADRRLLTPPTSCILTRDAWVIPLHDGSPSSQGVPVLTCVPARMLCTTSRLPREACDVIVTAPPLSPWYDAQGNKLNDDGRKLVTPNAAATIEQTAQLPHASASMPDVVALREQVTALETQCSELKTENKSLSREAADASEALDAAQRNAQVSRQMYHQASEAARVALSESAEAEDKVAKLQRQLTEGLASHRERFNVARAAWKEQERQLKARLQILESQDRRADDAEVRRKVNEWKVAKLNEEAAAKKAQEVQKRVQERMKAEEEIDDDELAALRREAQMSTDDDAAQATSSSSSSSRARRSRRAIPQSSEVSSQVATPLDAVSSSGEEVSLSQQGPFARPAAPASPGGPSLLSDPPEAAPSSYASIAAGQNAEASRLLAAARQSANVTASTSLHPAGLRYGSKFSASDLSRLDQDRETRDRLERAEDDFIERAIEMEENVNHGAAGPPDPEDTREVTEDRLDSEYGRAFLSGEYMEIYNEVEEDREQRGLPRDENSSSEEVDFAEYTHE